MAWCCWCLGNRPSGVARDSRSQDIVAGVNCLEGGDLPCAILVGDRFPQSLVIKGWQWGNKRGYGTYVKTWDSRKLEHSRHHFYSFLNRLQPLLLRRLN